MSYGVSLAVHENPPEDFGAGRRCAKCGSKVSRYQNKYHGTLLCFRCQNNRLYADESVEDLVRANRVAERTLAGGRKLGRTLAGLGPLLHRRKMTCSELSEASGVSRRFVEDLRSERKRASDECTEVLARTLGVEPDELRCS